MEAVKRESYTVASEKRDRWDEKQTGGNLPIAGDVYLEILEVFWNIWNCTGCCMSLALTSG